MRFLGLVGSLLGLSLAVNHAKAYENSIIDKPAEVKPARLMLGPNDVSILFPIDSSLPVGTSGSLGELLSQDAFKQVLELAGKSKIDTMGPISFDFHAPAKSRENWHVLGFRFDPCFPSIANCATAHLRLIVQPKVADSFLDYTLHLVYGLPLEKRAEFVSSLTALKAESPVPTDGPLGIHPGMSASKEFSSHVHALITSAVGQKNMIGAAFMGIQDSARNEPIQDPWIFFAAAMKDSKLQTITIPDTGNSHFQGVGGFANSFPRAKLETPSVQKFLRSVGGLHRPDFDRAKGLQAGVDEIFMIENPLLVSQPGTDCVSCHASTSIRVRLANGVAGADPRVLESQFRFVSKAGVSVEPENPFYLAGQRQAEGEANGTETYVLRNFGYFQRTPQIAQRTLNETATVVEYVRANLM